MIRALVFSASLILSPFAQADLHKWVDKDGKVTYSDQAPPETAKQATNLHPGRKASASPAVAATNPVPKAAAKTPAELDADFKKRQVEKAEAEAKKQKELAEAADKRKNCETAQNQLKQLEAGGRFTRAGPNGETLFMDDKEIDEAKASTRKIADSWCKG